MGPHPLGDPALGDTGVGDHQAAVDPELGHVLPDLVEGADAELQRWRGPGEDGLVAGHGHCGPSGPDGSVYHDVVEAATRDSAVPGMAGPDDLAADDRVVDRQRPDAGGIDRERVAGEHGHVGQPSPLERSLAVLLEAQLGGLGGVRAQRCLGVHPLLGAQHVAVAGASLDRAPDALQRRDRQHRGVGVQAEAHAAGERRCQRVDPAGALRAEEPVAVAVSPVVHVLDEERRRHTRRGHRLQLLVARQLAVLDPVPPGRGAGGVVHPEQGVRVEHGLDRRVTVAVHGDLPPGLVQRRHPAGQVVAGVQQHAVLVRRAGVARGDARGERLDRPVRPELDPGDAEPVVADAGDARLHRAELSLAEARERGPAPGRRAPGWPAVRPPAPCGSAASSAAPLTMPTPVSCTDVTPASR